MAAALATRTISGRLSNIQAFTGEQGDVVYATLTSNLEVGQPLYCLTISGRALDAIEDHLVEDGFVRLICEVRPTHTTDRVLGLDGSVH
jgi:hypothetical protein